MRNLLLFFFILVLTTLNGSTADYLLDNSRLYPRECADTEGVAYDISLGRFACGNVGGGGSGEANTASNVGGGLGVFFQKSGVDLEFNSFLAADFDLASSLISIDDAKWATDAELALQDECSEITGCIENAITASSVDTLTNKSGSNSQWTNDEGYLTAEVDGSTTNELQDLFSGITDGTNTATVDSNTDTFKLRSANSLFSVVVANDDVTHGDSALMTVEPALSNYTNDAGFITSESDPQVGTIQDASYCQGGIGQLDCDVVTLPDADIAATIHRDSEVKDGDLVDFDDADTKFTATNVDSALSELDDANASGPNDTTFKVNWEQLGNVPAGFADGVDDISGSYETIEDEGVALTQRTIVNFTGAGVTCTDDSGNSETDCDIPGGGGDSVNVNSTAVDDANFLDGDIDWTLNAGANPDEITATVACTDCVTLGTETAGNYVASVEPAVGPKQGLTVFPSSPSEGTAVEVGYDYSQSPAINTLEAGMCVFATGGVDKGILCEGSTNDGNETIITVRDPTAGRTILFPDAGGDVVLDSSTDTLTNKTIDTANNTITIVEADISDLGSYFDTAGRSLTAAGTTIDADSELYTRTKSATILEPSDTGMDGLVQMVFPSAVTLTRVWCSTDVGTVTIQFDERAEATPNSAGTDVMTSALVCDTDTQATTAFDNAGIASRVPMSMDIDAVATAPKILRVHVEYTLDD